MENSIQCHLSLGSNLGDRERNLKMAVMKLNENSAVDLVESSPIYETEPIGMGQVPWFLNMAIKIETTLSASKLLEACQEIEKMLGREDKGKNYSRYIDIDILTYGREIVDETSLQIPHPKMKERLFVLYPLSDIAPEYKESLQKLGDSHKVTPYEPTAT